MASPKGSGGLGRDDLDGLHSAQVETYLHRTRISADFRSTRLDSATNGFSNESRPAERAKAKFAPFSSYASDNEQDDVRSLVDNVRYLMRSQLLSSSSLPSSSASYALGRMDLPVERPNEIIAFRPLRIVTMSSPTEYCCFRHQHSDSTRTQRAKDGHTKLHN